VGGGVAIFLYGSTPPPPYYFHLNIFLIFLYRFVNNSALFFVPFFIKLHNYTHFRIFCPTIQNIWCGCLVNEILLKLLQTILSRIYRNKFQNFSNNLYDLMSWRCWCTHRQLPYGSPLESTFHCCRAADWGQVSRTLEIWPSGVVWQKRGAELFEGSLWCKKKLKIW